LYATTGVLSLIGGAAFGIAAMYLLDPQQGSDRRARAMGAAHRALDTTSDAALSAYHAAADKVSQVGSKVCDATSAASDAMPTQEQISDTAHSWLASARRMVSRRPQLERHSDYAMNPGAVSATTAGALALGAGAMWLFDPSKGRARRAWIGQKARRFLNDIAGRSRATGRHLRNKTQGYYHQAASHIQEFREAPTA
jgi:gas vesicle protein